MTLCGHFNREGQLCGTCKKGYGPALFTNYECAECSAKNYGWALYLLLEFLPITVFYLIIVIFQISTTSGPLNVLIFSVYTNDCKHLKHSQFLVQCIRFSIMVPGHAKDFAYILWGLELGLHSFCNPTFLFERKHHYTSRNSSAVRICQHFTYCF